MMCCRACELLRSVTCQFCIGHISSLMRCNCMLAGSQIAAGMNAGAWSLQILHPACPLPRFWPLINPASSCLHMAMSLIAKATCLSSRDQQICSSCWVPLDPLIHEQRSQYVMNTKGACVQVCHARSSGNRGGRGCAGTVEAAYRHAPHAVGWIGGVGVDPPGQRPLSPARLCQCHPGVCCQQP